jgi:hypothetical protein
MVSLVSEQTVPNILAILHFQPDKLLFISTEKMERKNKVEAILKALENISGKKLQRGQNVDIICVVEDSIYDCHSCLENWIKGKEDDDYIVNLTGGTKLMSIATFEFFKNYGSKMIYIPLNKNEYISPFPIRAPKPPLPIRERLSVIQYLYAYGLDVLNIEKTGRYKSLALKRKENSSWIVEHYGEIQNVLDFLGNELRDAREKKLDKFHFRKEYMCRTVFESKFLLEMGFYNEGKDYAKKLSKDEILYLTGGWLEEYCFNVVNELLGTLVDDAVLNIQIRNPQGSDNEFDVMFTSDNALYFIECKSMEQKHLGKKHEEGFGDFLYKIGALQNEFGLRVESFLVTNSSLIVNEEGKIKQSLLDRAKQFKTEIIGPNDVIHFSDILKEALQKT